MVTVYFPGVKRSGRGVDHPHKSSAEVKERVGLYLYFSSGLSWSVIGLTFYTRAVVSDSTPHCTLTALQTTVGSAVIPGIPFCHETNSVLSQLLLKLTMVHCPQFAHDSYCFWGFCVHLSNIYTYIYYFNLRHYWYYWRTLCTSEIQ